VIRTFRHKGLQEFFRDDNARSLNHEHVQRISRLLDRLDASVKPQDMNFPGFGFQPLKGDRKGTYSVSVSGSWRITFRFDGENVVDVDLEDYH
jgi:proteic killer suppression protein